MNSARLSVSVAFIAVVTAAFAMATERFFSVDPVGARAAAFPAASPRATSREALAFGST